MKVLNDPIYATDFNSYEAGDRVTVDPAVFAEHLPWAKEATGVVATGNPYFGSTVAVALQFKDFKNPRIARLSPGHLTLA